MARAASEMAFLGVFTVGVLSAGVSAIKTPPKADCGRASARHNVDEDFLSFGLPIPEEPSASVSASASAVS